MSCSKCGCGKSKKLCPCTLGLAIGLTCALGMFLMALWLMYYGAVPMMADLPTPTWKDVGIVTLVGFVKGFLFGFFIALFYNWISCCCKKAGVCGVCKCSCACDCCKNGCNCKGGCNCSCACCSGNKTEAKPTV